MFTLRNRKSRDNLSSSDVKLSLRIPYRGPVGMELVVLPYSSALGMSSESGCARRHFILDFSPGRVLAKSRGCQQISIPAVYI